MITKFNDFSGVFSAVVDGDLMYMHLRYNEDIFPFEVQIYVNDELYCDLSVIIPDSKKLERDEFFLNPIVDKSIVKVLERENFIQETGYESIAGDKKTKSYSLVI